MLLAGDIQWSLNLRNTLSERHWSGLIYRIAEDLIVWPALNVNVVIAKHGANQPTTQNAIDRLVEIGALRETTGRTYARVYRAPEVIRIVNRL